MPAVADAHMHLDKLLKDTGHPAPVARLKAMSCCITPNVKLEFFVVNFSFLSQNNMHWPQSPEEIMDPLSRLAYSIHPKTAGELTDTEVCPLMLQLEQHLQHPKVIALAEVGLDFSKLHLENQQHQKIVSQQKKVLKSQLEIAKRLKLPITIHVHDKVLQMVAADQCLQILQAILPSEWPIYCHCFLGNVAQFQKWVDAFPNLVIGIGWKAMNLRDHDVHEVVRTIALSCILLQTDALLQIPACYNHAPYEPSHDLKGNPYMIANVAQAVADIHGIPYEVVCAATLQNTEFFFHC